MPEQTVFEEEEPRERRRIASFLRRVADALGRGEPVPANEEQTVTVEPPAEADFEVEVEREEGEVSLEIELEWEEDAGGAVDTEAQASQATFEVYEDNAEEWRWRLRHRNGNVIADGSEGYASRQKAEQGLESVRRNAPGAYVEDQTKVDPETDAEEGGSDATFELFYDAEQKARWRLRHDNGNVIADSGQGYSSKQKAKQGLGSVQQNAVGAPVEDLE